MLLSNYSLPMTLYLAPIRISLEFVALFYSLFCLDLNHFFGILQSFVWVLTPPHIIYKRRKHIQQLRKIKDSEVINKMYWGSIVFDYYIRRIKKSSDIINEWSVFQSFLSIILLLLWQLYYWHHWWDYILQYHHQ